MWEEVDISERHLKNCAVGAVELYGALEHWRRVGGLEHRLSVGVLEERWNIGGGLEHWWRVGPLWSAGALELWSTFGALEACVCGVPEPAGAAIEPSMLLPWKHTTP